MANAEIKDSVVIPANAIRPVATLHLTLGVMSLVSLERVADASIFLRNLNVQQMLYEAGEFVHNKDAADSVDGTSLLRTDQDLRVEEILPLKVTVSGLHPMHTPSSTSILYASPLDSTSRLFPFAIALQKAFAEAELLLPEDRNLRLHATIVNTIYAKDKKTRAKDSGHGKNSKSSRKFDARELIARYEKFEWATDVHIERIGICEMGAKKTIKNGEVVNEEYLEVAGTALP